MMLQHMHPKDRRLTWKEPNTLLPEVQMLGWEAWRSATPKALSPHRHGTSFEICLIVGGRVEWWVESDHVSSPQSPSPQPPAVELYTVEPQHVFVTRPGEAHGGLDTMMHPCELYWVQLR